MVSPNFDAFSGREDLVFFIDRFNAIEENLAELIANNISPPKSSERFVKDIVLNNSIISFSSKVKLFMHLRAINSWPKIEAGDFHKLMSIRNQFAHCNHKAHVNVKIGEGDNEKAGVSISLMLESVANAGQIVAVESADALQQFTEIYARIRDYFSALRDV